MRRFPGFLLILFAVIGLIVVISAVRGALPDGLPFTTKKVERSQPVLVQSLEDIGEFRAASANLQVIVDLEKDTRFVPSFVAGRRMTMVVPGEVDAGIDFSSLPPGTVTANDDRTRATVRVTAPVRFPARIDPDGIEIAGETKGLINRLSSVFTSNDSFQTEVLRLAETRLEEAAAADSSLDTKARENVRAMLTELLGQAGYDEVVVEFIEPEIAPS